MVEGVLFCSSDTVVFVPDQGEPEDYAGFCDDHVHIYVSKEAVLSDKVIEVLSCYERVTMVNSIRIPHIEMLRGALELYSGKPWEVAMAEFEKVNQ